MLVIKLAVFVYERKAALVWRKPYDTSRQKRLFVNAFTCLVYVGIMTRKEFFVSDVNAMLVAVLRQLLTKIRQHGMP